MPTFEYICEKCGTFERSQGMNDPAIDACPNCGGKVERLISGGAGFVMGGRSRPAGHTCCGREERCDTPPCGDGECCQPNNR